MDYYMAPFLEDNYISGKTVLSPHASPVTSYSATGLT